MIIERTFDHGEYKYKIIVESKSLHGHSAMESIKDGIQAELIDIILLLKKASERHKQKYGG